MPNPVYVLITAAKNEQDYIERTLQSVINQTIRPAKWVIVNDGSTDDTEKIVRAFAEKHAFIQLINRQSDGMRDFGSKVVSIMTGYEQLKNETFDYIGNIDADVSFEKTYYESMLGKFRENAKLGIVGGVRFDLDGDRFVPVKCAQNSVGGPFQFFRRACFEEVGGYIPVRYGGEDSVIEITARMKGWEVRSFPDYRIRHHRMTSSRTASNRIQQKWKEGLRVYLVGYCPVYFTFKVMRTIYSTRRFIDVFILLGFYSGFLRPLKRPVTKEFIQYLRKENKSRLKSILKSGNDPLSHRLGDLNTHSEIESTSREAERKQVE